MERLAAGAEVLDGIYPMIINGGVVLVAIADDRVREELEAAVWKPRLLALLREELGPQRQVADVAGVLEDPEQERFFGVPR